MNPFATHMPTLLACLQHTSGPVLELGSGWFSTPVLSAFATDRLVRTMETDRDWHGRVSRICTNQPITPHRHQIIYVPDYEEAPLFDQNWDIVLLDHEPPPRRGVDALRLRVPTASATINKAPTTTKFTTTTHGDRTADPEKKPSRR